MEQLFNAMLRLWVGERKPETGKKAGRLADDRKRDGTPQRSMHPTATRKCHLLPEIIHKSQVQEQSTTNSQDLTSLSRS